jgi:hypothetical protein
MGDLMTSPALGQAFAIGSALGGVNVPNGASRLYLGLHNGFEWTNNSGLVEVTIEGTDRVVPEVGGFVVWSGLLALAIGLHRRVGWAHVSLAVNRDAPTVALPGGRMIVHYLN